MGCFDYKCECEGTKCVYIGGQNGGDSTVVIEVPLNDGTTVYVKGHYNSYGAVETNGCTFYPEQFNDYFDYWLTSEQDEPRSKIFLAKRIWTVSYYHYNEETKKSFLKKTNCYPENITILIKLGKSTIEKCIRADSDMNILSDAKKREERVKTLKSQIEHLQNELDQLVNIK